MTDNRSRTGSGMRSRNTAARSSGGVASRELQAARRRKRQREVMRNRIIFGVGAAVVLILIIFLIVKLIGLFLNSGKAADTSTLTFEKNGQVVFEEVIDFDPDTYSKNELKGYTNELIDSFNDTYGDTAITLDKFSVKDDKVYIKTTYKDADCYSTFTSLEVYNSTYEDAISTGYDFNELFCIVTEEGLSEPMTVDADSVFAGTNVAIVKENVTVVVPGEITYVSSASTQLVDSATVTISQADGNADATDLVYIIYLSE